MHPPTVNSKYQIALCSAPTVTGSGKTATSNFLSVGKFTIYAAIFCVAYHMDAMHAVHGKSKLKLSSIIQTQVVRPLCPTHIIAMVIMTEGKLGLKQLAQGCTCAPGNTPSQGPWVKWF